MIRLDAINRILVSAQLSTVASIATPDEFVAKAITILDDTVKRELERGWDFNQDYNYVLTLAGSNFTLPSTPWTVLNADVRPEESSGKDIVVRENKLYNKTDRTFTFTQTTINVDITWNIAFDDLPLVMQEYVVACSCVRFATQVSVDPEIARALRLDEARAWQRLKQSDTEQSTAGVYNRYPLYQIARNWPVIR